MSNLGDMYYHAQGVTRSLDEAIYWRYRAYMAGRIQDAQWLEDYLEHAAGELQSFRHRWISEKDETSLAVRIGDPAQKVLNLFGQPDVKGRTGVHAATGTVWTETWHFDCGRVEVRSNVVVSSTILLTTNDLANGTKPDIPKDWRIYPTLKPDNPKYWALATSALLTEYNEDRHDLLGTEVKSAEHAQAQAWTLFHWWDIANREDLLEKLEWIEVEGHRAEFEKVVWFLLQQGNDSTNAVARLREAGIPENKILVARSEHANLGSKSLLGWDYARYVSLCRWGYLVGYLTEEEAWARLMPVARLLQNTFDSWEDLGKNYLIGRRFWSARQTDQDGEAFERTYQKLIKEPSSPWRLCRWDMDLSEKRVPEGTSRGKE